MLVESTIMLNTMLTLVAKITKKQAMAMADLGSDSPSSDIELAGSASVDLEPANVTISSGQRSLLDVLKLEKLKRLKREFRTCILMPPQY